MAAVTEAPPPISAPTSTETALRMAGSMRIFGSNERGCASNGSKAALHEPGDLGYSGGSPTAQRPSHPGKQSLRSGQDQGQLLSDLRIGRQCLEPARVPVGARLFSCDLSRHGIQHCEGLRVPAVDTAGHTHRGPASANLQCTKSRKGEYP